MCNRKPLISVIVPVYNVERYIEQCIESICTQTYRNLEIILVDDGSTDKSDMLCDQFSKVDNRIRVIHKKNGGLSSARNTGIKEAKGDYIGFVDSDDWIDKRMYKNLLKALQENNAEVACCGRTLFYSENYQKKVYDLPKPMKWTNAEAIERLLVWDAIDSSACDKLFLSNVFEKIRFPEGKLHEDIYVMYKILDNAKSIVHIGETNYFYRQRVGGITRNKYSHKKTDLLDVVDEINLYISKKHPELIGRAMGFSIVNVDAALYQFLQSRNNLTDYSEDYYRLMSMFEKYSVGYVKNPYISNREKFKILLIKLKLTNLYIMLKDKYLLIRR